MSRRIHPFRCLPRVPWLVPEEKKPEEAKKEEIATSQPATQPASQPTSSPSADTPTTQPTTAATTAATTKPTSTAPAEAPEKKSAPGGKDMKKNGKPGKDPLKIDKQWLKYSDTKRGGEGFVDWTPFEHPVEESLALARFVLDHPNIAAVLVYGRHDNMIKVPGDKARDISGRGYRHLHPDDTPVYKHLSERFKVLTDLKGAAEHDDAGAFFGWTYNQRGLPTIATTLWWVPEEKKPEEAKKEEIATSQPATQPASQPTSSPSADTPTTQPTTAATTAATTKPTSTAPAEAPEKKSAPGGKDMKKNGKPGKDPLKIDKQWLKYSDTKRGGEGFVDWTPFEHPTLGQVEIGGFVPGFRINPPAHEVAGIAEKQLAFVKDLAERLPKPHVADCKVTRKSDSIFEIELSMTNDAYLPTAMGMAKAARVAFPFVLRLDLPAEDVLGGRRVHRINSLGGLGATEKVRWLIRGRAGQNLTISIYHKRFGTIQHTVRLEQSDEGVKP